MTTIESLVLDAHDALNDCGLGQAADAILVIPDAPPAVPLRVAWDALLRRNWGRAEQRAAEAIRALEGAIDPALLAGTSERPTDPVPDSGAIVEARHRMLEIVAVYEQRVALEDAIETWDPSVGGGVWS